ncbi:MAG: cell division protein SepF [Christensenellales bacterium]|jgi:cell division inhibitor SepF
MGFEDANQTQTKPEKEEGKTKRRNKSAKPFASFSLKEKKKENQTLETFKLRSEEEILPMIDVMKKKGGVVVDLSMLSKDKKIRAFDFISGATFALEGRMEKIETNIYVCVLEELNFLLEE